jgi:hypothetical protein
MFDSGFEIVREFNVDLVGLSNFVYIAMEEKKLVDFRIQGYYKLSRRKQLTAVTIAALNSNAKKMFFLLEFKDLCHLASSNFTHFSFVSKISSFCNA